MHIIGTNYNILKSFYPPNFPVQESKSSHNHHKSSTLFYFLFKIWALPWALLLYARAPLVENLT